MVEVKGDFWKYHEEHKCSALVCLTNWSLDSQGHLIMGAGLAREFAERYPYLPEEWGRQVDRNPAPKLLFAKEKPVVQSYHLSSEYLYLISFPTKDKVWKPAKLDLIKLMTAQLQIWAEDKFFAHEEILMGRPGCGLGNLKWDDVKPILQERLDNRFKVISND